MIEIEQLLDYWFGAPGMDCEVGNRQAAIWWRKSDETDAYIAEHFGALLDQAARDELDHWAQTARGTLALLILLDQFSRNIHRGTDRAFAQDQKALALTLSAIEAGLDKELSPIQRVFIYLPLEHAESVDMQSRCVRCFKKLHQEAAGSCKELFANYVNYAEQHKVIIDRFGRFPHRNEILGRDSTDEEQEFLTQPGSSF